MRKYTNKSSYKKQIDSLFNYEGCVTNDFIVTDNHVGKDTLSALPARRNAPIFTVLISDVSRIFHFPANAPS